MKSPENDFFDPQNGQNMDVNFVKRVDFFVNFRSMSPNIASLAPTKFKKSFPLIDNRHDFYLKMNFT